MSDIALFYPLIGTLIGGFVGNLIAALFKSSNRWPWAYFGGLVPVLFLNLLVWFAWVVIRG